MINEIGNVLPKQLIEQIIKVFDKNSENGKSGYSGQRVEEKTTKTVIENGTLIMEQYDRHGKLMR